jgi:hypothetical protein
MAIGPEYALVEKPCLDYLALWATLGCRPTKTKLPAIASIKSSCAIPFFRQSSASTIFRQKSLAPPIKTCFL